MSRRVTTKDLLDFAVEAAWKAGQSTLAHFQTGIDVERKRDDSPVTVADRHAEQILRSLITARFPDDAIVGEEFGGERKGSHRWILDPIDGTQSFVRGVPLYGVLVALEVEGEPLVGVSHFPALGETVAAATGEGCWWNGRRARVSTVDRIDAALVVYTDGRELSRRLGSQWTRLQAESRLQRGWGDCYGHCLVATGRAEVMLDPVVNPWDCAALAPILREAGGTFTDWGGSATIHGPDAVGTNGLLLDTVLARLRTTSGQE